jgi:cell division protein FtsQ
MRSRPLAQPLVKSRLVGLLTSRGFDIFYAAALLLAVGGFGAVEGGQYAAFVAAQGTIPDIIARNIGFGIEAVTISGLRELTESEILAAGEIGPRNSLVFLDAVQIRDRLRAMPLVREASVAKLYPNRLLIEVEERQPFALWQKDGAVKIVASDGAPIDDMRDAHFVHLPFVVGDGANARIGEYTALVDSAGPLRDRIRAGMLVGQRRWTLKTTNGIDILLPETNPQAAVALLVQLQRDAHVLDKDILALDMRQPGRVVARLSEEAASARADMLARKTKSKGGTT